MKHLDERERTDVAPARLSPRDRQRLRELLQQPPQRKRGEAQAGSAIGLVLAVGILACLAWLLSPSDPVSSKLIP